MVCQSLDWYATAYDVRVRMRKKNNLAYIPSVAMYNVIKRLGSEAINHSAKMVSLMLLIDDIVTEHTKYREEVESSRRN